MGCRYLDLQGRAGEGMRSLGGRLRSASLLACAVLLLAAPRPGSGQGLLLGGQLGSTPSLGRLLDPGPAVPVSNAAGGDDGGMLSACHAGYLEISRPVAGQPFHMPLSSPNTACLR